MKKTTKSYILAVKGKRETGETENERRNRITRCIEALVENGSRSFVCVMNEEGVSVARCICEVKKAYPDVTFDALIPYETVYADWDESLRDEFFDVIGQCENESFFEHRYCDGLYQKMIDKLVNGTNHVITVLI